MRIDLISSFMKRDTGGETALLFLDILICAIMPGLTTAILLNEEHFPEDGQVEKEKEPIN